MRKIILLLIVLTGLVSCKQPVLEQNNGSKAYGIVTINLGGNTAGRAVDGEGLPLLPDSVRTRIILTRKKAPHTELGRKAFSDPLKKFSLTVPVGEEITISATAENATAVWSAKKDFTVKSGQNNVTVLFDKKVAALKDLLFTAPESGQQTAETQFMVKIVDKEIIPAAAVSAVPSVCRDNKGRIYTAYKPANGSWTIKQYTSEANAPKDISLNTVSSAPPIEKIVLVSDYTTGITYVIVKTSGDEGAVYREKGGKLIPLTHNGQTVMFPMLCAVDNGYVVSVKRSTSIHVEDTLLIRRLTHNQNAGENEEAVTIEDIREKPIGYPYQIENYQNIQLHDICIHDGFIYTLFGCLNMGTPDEKWYSVGGLVRWPIDTESNSLDVKPMELYGFEGRLDFENNKVLKDYPYDTCFARPVKFIGFDKQNNTLSIADDGMSFACENEYIKVKTNYNRIASFNTETKTLTFKDAPAGVTWFAEKEAGKNIDTTISIDIGFED